MRLHWFDGLADNSYDPPHTTTTTGAVLKITRWVKGAAALASATLVLTACGSSSDETEKDTGASGSDTTEGAGGTAAAKAAAADIKPLFSRPTDLEVPPLPSKPPTGKTVIFVACGVPVCVQFGTHVKEAAEAAGWNYKQLDGGVTPQSLNAAYEQAAREKPAGVIGSGGFPQELFQRQIDKLEAAGVPVVLLFVEKAGPGVKAVVNDGDDLREAGEIMGKFILADAGGKDVNLTIVNALGSPIFEGSHEEMEAVLQDCEGCTVKKIDVTYEDIGTKMPQIVSTHLAANPKTNYMFFNFANMTQGVPAALKVAGQADKVKLVTFDTSATQSQYIKNGELYATAGFDNVTGLWIAFDHVLRAAMDEPPVDIALSDMLITQDNIYDTTSDIFPLVEDYKKIFLEAWQLS